ncbi:hypothetical protein DFO70_101323 [Cytobacillus firmus]|uniref:Uncharacterized protein n=3 Tax=Bacillaceae TaxID=186817 RepID=A0A366K7B2_CYTFI|nr:hypothetical protein DFO70_101323 [Cytobacillus firmus]TDX45762.1 hypothetical protein DFO72_102233 [Cytobacillus oceanisediminis]
MSDMRSTYNRIYRIDKDSDNPMEQQQLFFYTGNDSKSPKSAEPDNKLDSEENQKDTGRSISGKKTKSFPLILPPPAVEARQIIKTSVQPEKAADKETPEENVVPAKGNSHTSKANSIVLPKNLKEMLTPFSPMLSWSPSLPSKYSNNRILLSESKSSMREDKHLLLAETIPADDLSHEMVQIDKEIGPSLDNENSIKAITFEEELDLTEEFIRLLENHDIADTSKTIQTAESQSDYSIVSEAEVFNEEDGAEDNTPAMKSSLFLESANSLEEEFAGMLEESSSSDDESANYLYHQDQVFALLLDSSNNRSESSSYHHTRYVSVNCEAESSEPDEAHPLEESSCDRPMKEWQSNLSEESSSYEGEFSRLLKEACSLLDMQAEDTIPLQEKFLALMEESSDSNHLFFEVSDDEFFLASESESSESADDDEEKYDKVSSLLEHFSAMLQDITFNEAPNSESEEPPSLTTEIESISESISEETSSDMKFNHQLEESSSSSCILVNEQQTLCYRESRSNGPIVKLPVLVGKTDMAIQIFDCFPINCKAMHITKVEWQVDSLSCKALFPSPSVFVKGVLIADTMFTADQQLKNVRIPISIEKSVELEWVCPPDLPQSSCKNEFMFLNENALDQHFEYSQQFSEEITCKLNSIHVLWYSTVMENEGLEIQGKAVLSIDFLQEQYVQI